MQSGRKKRYPVIDGIGVDVMRIGRLAHDCRPELCARTTSCCARYEVCVEEDELAKIVGGMALARRWAERLKAGGRPTNPFDETDDGLYAIDTDEDGLCVFACRDRRGRALCSLHAGALAAGVRPVDVKPRSCHLWPLAMAEGRPPVLTVVDDRFDLPCNRRRRGANRLDAGIARILHDAFGRKFLDKVSAAMQT